LEPRAAVSRHLRSATTVRIYYGDRQIADRSYGGGVDVGFLEVAAEERGLALAATEV
jgi:hypothetical protein